MENSGEYEYNDKQIALLSYSAFHSIPDRSNSGLQSNLRCFDFGNSCLIIVVFKVQTFRKTINFRTVSMAISDLLIPLIQMPWQVLALQQNVLKVTLVTVVGLILCWLPHNMNSILQLFIPEKRPCRFSLYRRFSTLLMASYCIMNPCICFTLSRKLIIVRPSANF